MALLNAKNLGKSFLLNGFALHVLKDINFSIQSGELLAITGKSGSGKSTLMNIIGCLDVPSTGVYSIDGISTSTMSPDELSNVRNKKIGFIFQQFNLLPDLTALENVALPQLYANKSEQDASQRAQKMLELVLLGDRLDHYPHQLSGGQQQRVAIARGLVNHPEVILADEPTGNLDSKTGELIMSIFLDLNKQKNMTIIIVTHDPDLAAQTNRNIVLLDGSIVEDKKI